MGVQCDHTRKFKLVMNADDPVCDIVKVTGIISLLLGALIIALNGIIIRRYFAQECIQRKVVNMLLTQLAVVDIMNAFYAFLNGMESISPCFAPRIGIKAKKNLRVTSIFMFVFLAFAFVLSHFVIALERFLAIWKPLFHRVKVDFRLIASLLVVVWTIALLFPALQMIMTHLWKKNIIACDTVNKLNLAYYEMYFGCSVIVLTIFTLNFWLARKAVIKHSQRIRISVKHHEDLGRWKQELRLVKAFSLMYVGFLISALPVLCVAYINRLSKTTAMAAHHIWRITFLGSTVFNPAVTLNLKKDFQRKKKNNQHDLS